MVPQAYFILDEFVMAGEIQETSIKTMLKHIYDQNMLEKGEVRVAALLIMCCRNHVELG